MAFPLTASFRSFCLAAVCLPFITSGSVDAALVWDNGIGAAGDAVFISEAEHADDFVLAAAASIDGIRLWAYGAVSGADIGVSGDFSGTIGWAIHADNGGVPGAILFSGADNSVPLTPDGLDASPFGPEYILDVDVVPTVNLGAGTYWLQLREGAIGSAFDGTPISWVTSVNQQGAFYRVGPIGEEIPPIWFESDGDLSFQLTSVDQSAASVPEPSTLVLAGLGAAGIAWRRRRRR